MDKLLCRLRRQRGFTLVELMIVVAVIGILSMVLLPKIGTIKTQAKYAGLDTNMRMVQSIVQSLIEDYAGRGEASGQPLTNEGLLQQAIITALNANGDVSQQVKDPFTSWSGAVLATSNVSPGTNAVVVSTATNATGPQSGTNVLSNTTPANNAGVIYVTVYPSTGNAGCDIWATMTAYDNLGNAVAIKQVTVEP